MKILYLQYTNPAGYPPLEHSSSILANDGWEVLFLGIGAFGADGLIFPQHPNITVKQIPFSSPGWRQKLHYLWFCLWVISWTFRWRPQAVYTSDVLSCPIALSLNFLTNAQIYYHEHDSPDSSTPSTFAQVCLSARKLLSDRAAACIFPNQQRLEKFIQTTARKSTVPMFCVWNCPNRTEIAIPQQPKIDDNLWLFYHGSIVPPQLPETIVQAIAMLPENVKLRIVGYETIGHIGYVQHLKELAIQLNIHERIEYLGTVPTRGDLLQQCQKCDVGLSLFPADNTQPMPGASNKPFDYLACGLALLVSNLPDWTEMYVDPGYGLACNPEDPESIAKALQWYIEHPNKMREMGEQGRQRILSEWNYEAQFSLVKNQLNKNITLNLAT